MPKMVMILGFGAVMFGVSAAGSWFVHKTLNAKTSSLAVEEKPAEAGAHGEHGDAHAADGGHGEEKHDATDSHGSVVVHNEPVKLAKGPLADPLPVSIRPRDFSAEELLRMGMALKQREQDLKKQEELFDDRRIRQNTALEDMKGERREIDGLRIQLNDQLKQAESLVNRMNEARVRLEQSKVQLDAEVKRNQVTNGQSDGDIAGKNKKLAEWIQNMDAEQAAQAVKSLANSGQKDTVVQIFANMDAQQVSAILSAIAAEQDATLVQELIQAYQTAKLPAKNPPK